MEPIEVLQEAKQAVIAVLLDPEIDLSEDDTRHLHITIGLIEDYQDDLA